MKRLSYAIFAAVLLTVGFTAAAAGPLYYLNVDLVRGAEGAPQGAVCVPNSVFLPGESMVWRAKVYDSATGAELTAAQVEELGISIAISISDGQNLDLHYAGHPPGANLDYYFTNHLIIPDDEPAGTLTWTATAKDSKGNSATFEPVGQKAGLGLLTIASKD